MCPIREIISLLRNREIPVNQCTLQKAKNKCIEGIGLHNIDGVNHRIRWMLR